MRYCLVGWGCELSVTPKVADVDTRRRRIPVDNVFPRSWFVICRLCGRFLMVKVVFGLRWHEHGC
jgi:hypothetical protein